MTHDDSNEARKPRRVAKRRVALLTSVALVAVAGLIAGRGYDNLQWTEAAHAQVASQRAEQPAGFADLVQNVRPAVVSVRVRIEEAANTADPSLDSDDVTCIRGAVDSAQAQVDAAIARARSTANG